MVSQLYDDATELQLNELICELDVNPIICTDPVEDSSYLKINLYTSEEGFQRIVEIKYNQHLAYLDQFIKLNATSIDGQTHLMFTLNRLLVKYQNSHQQFIDSPARLDWKIQSTSFSNRNPKNDFILQQQQNYTREAYRFFYKMSLTQLFFLSGIEEYITQQLKPYSSVIQEQIIKSDILPQPVIYHFKIRPEATKDSHYILQFIHKHLKDKEFITCTLPEFKQVFTSKTPTPILWLKDYIQLSYLIKNLSEKFLCAQKSPSNYRISTKLFYNKCGGAFFNPSKIRHDKDPNQTDKVIIDFIIKNSTDHFLREY